MFSFCALFILIQVHLDFVQMINENNRIFDFMFFLEIVSPKRWSEFGGKLKIKSLKRVPQQWGKKIDLKFPTFENS